MSDIASLIIRVATEGADRASTELDGLGGAALKAAGAIGGLAAATSVFNKLIDSQRNFDQLNAGLITMTGSAANAAEAFGALQQFAATTPFDLDQAVKGFTQLVALGLNPSQEALTSFGNTAAAMGKDLNQMIEAVADAATGEFERLKEFGIKASQQGDKVSFTFRGVTTTVKKSADDIQKYLINIGNTDFAGAMQERANTLDGALSNLDDSWAALVLSIARSGFGDAVREQVEVAATQIGNLTDLISSGELQSAVGSWATMFDSSFSFISDWLNQLNNDVADTAAEISPFGKDVADEIGIGFDTLPAYVAAVIQDVAAQFMSLVDQAKTVGDAIVNALNPLADGDWPEQFRAELSKNTASLIQQQKVIYDTRDQEIGAYNDAIEASKKQREEYQKNKAARVDLGKYGITPQESGNSGQSDKEKKAADTAAKRLAKEKEYALASLEQLKQDNFDEIALIDAKEQEKLKKFTDYRAKDLISQAQLETAKTQIQLNAEKERQDAIDKELTEEQKKLQQGVAVLASIDPVANLQLERQKRLAVIEEYEAQENSVHDVALQARAELDKQYNDGLAAAAEERFRSQSEWNDMLMDSLDAVGSSASSSIVGLINGTQTASEAMANLGNAILSSVVSGITQMGVEYLKNLIIGQTASAASIAMASVTGAAIASAYAPAAAMASLASFGGNSVPAMTGITTTVVGAQALALTGIREQGGQVNVGGSYLVGERGPEIIRMAGAGRVTNASQTRQQLNGQNSGNSGPSNVTIVNNTSSQIGNVSTEQDDEGRLRIIIEEQVAASLQNSNSKISKARRATRGQAGY